MKGESSIFKLFLTIELAKPLNNIKETIQYRYIIDLQDQSKSFISQQTQNILFFLNEIENDTYVQVKIVSDKTNKILGQLQILIPFAINYESEITVTEQFNIENESKLNGKYILYLINVPLFNQKQNSQIDTSQSKINQTSQISQSQLVQKKKQSKSPQPQSKQYYSKETYLQQINKEVNSILSKHNHSMSSKKDKTSETGFADESPSRLSDRVQVSRAGTIVQSEIAPNQIRQYVLEESPSKINSCVNKEINHRHHQDLSCLYYIDQATLTNKIQMENENLKEFIINLNNNIELKEQEIIMYRALQTNYNELQNQLKSYLKAQELTKSADTIFEKEILKINGELNNKINQLLENEKKFNKQKVGLEMQIAEQKKEINILRENLYQLSEKQKLYQTLNSDYINLKSQYNEQKHELLRNAKDYEGKIVKFEQQFLDQNKKFDEMNQQIVDFKKLNWELDKINKAQTFQIKKLQEKLQTTQPIINVKSTNSFEHEDQSKQIQVQQEINQQKQAEIDRLQSGLKKVQQQFQDTLNENHQVKAALNQAKQEIAKLKEQIASTQNKKSKQQTEQKSLSTQIESEKQKVNNLQNLIKAKNAQIQEAQAREENYLNKIQKLEQIVKQTRTLIDNQEEQITLLNNQVKDLQDIKQKQQNDLKEDKIKMNQLKSLICGMKEQKIAYIPMHGDPIDHALSEYINSVEDPKKLIELFFREQEGLYMIGSKSVNLKTEQGKVFVKVGGGYIGIEEFLDVYLKEKTDKIEKKQSQLTPRSKTPQKSQKSSTMQFTS